MNFREIISVFGTIILPSALTFFALITFEKKNAFVALAAASVASLMLVIAIGLNIAFSPSLLGGRIISGQDMNFTGQIAMLVFGLIFVFSRGKPFADKVGLFKVRPLRYFGWALVIGIAVFGIGWIEDLITDPPMRHIDYFQKFIFEMTLPGFSEELLFRGILLEIANSSLKRRWTLCGARFGLGLLAVSLPFGLGHLVSSQHPSLLIVIGRFTSTFASALALGWLKEKTSSLPCCVVAHNIANSLGTTIDYLLSH